MLAYELIGEIVAAATTTSVSFTGLNLTADDEYMLVSDIYNSDSSGGATMHILVNGNNTLTNYCAQNIYAEGASGTSARSNDAYFSYSYPSAYCEAITHFRLNNSGYFTYNSLVNYRNGTSACAAMRLNGTSKFTMSAITQITLLASVANKIMAGSRFRLYKLKAKKVADITVAAGSNYVDITGLNIDPTGEYLLCVEFTGTSGAFGLFVNGYTTDTSYYLQKISAAATSLNGYRYNSSTLAQYGSTGLSFAMVNLKLTSNGYLAAMSNSIRGVGGTSLENEDAKITSNFSMAAITTIRVASSLSSEIRTGTRLKLYKLM